MTETVKAPAPSTRYALLSGGVKVEIGLRAYREAVAKADRPEKLLTWATNNESTWKEAA